MADSLLDHISFSPVTIFQFIAANGICNSSISELYNKPLFSTKMKLIAKKKPKYYTSLKIACAYLFENERKNEFEEKIRKKIHILFKNNVEFDC